MQAAQLRGRSTETAIVPMREVEAGAFARDPRSIPMPGPLEE
jgi:hypothetical protein